MPLQRILRLSSPCSRFTGIWERHRGEWRHEGVAQASTKGEALVAAARAGGRASHALAADELHLGSSFAVLAAGVDVGVVIRLGWGVLGGVLVVDRGMTLRSISEEFPRRTGEHTIEASVGANGANSWSSRCSQRGRHRNSGRIRSRWSDRQSWRFRCQWS